MSSNPRAMYNKSRIVGGFFVGILRDHPIIGVGALAAAAAAAVAQGIVLVLLNSGVVDSQSPQEASVFARPSFMLALGIFILVAWLQYLSTRLVMSVWIARRNQNLTKLEALTLVASNEILRDLIGQNRTIASITVEKILFQLRSLNTRQGLAVRSVFGAASATMTLIAVITAAITINPPIAITIFSIALVAVVPTTLIHGGRMVSIERNFRAFTSLSTVSFRKLASNKLSLDGDVGGITFAEENNHVSANYSLVRRNTTPNWNRVIATTAVTGVAAISLIFADLLSYPAPPGGTILVLIVGLLVALGQTAALSGQVTSLGRFLDSIQHFNARSDRLKSSTTQHSLDMLLLDFQATSGGPQEIDEV